jgi:hypothetical protein
MKIRDEKTKALFAKYLAKYPEQRFMQAVRNFWNVPFLGVSNDLKEWEDTFYMEGDALLEEKKK